MVAGAALARNIVGILGNVISFGLFVSPAPTFLEIIRKKRVEEFREEPYLATALNCAFWVLYGMPFVRPHNILVLTINAVGLVFQLVYITIFYAYATKRRRKYVDFVLPLGTLFFAFVLIMMLAFHDDTKIRWLIVGIISDAFNIMTHISPLRVMAMVIRTKSVKYMPFWLSFANFYNGLCWVVYALIHPFDLFVLISNGIGAIFGLIQLILYAVYRSCNTEDAIDIGHVVTIKKPIEIQLPATDGAARA